MKTTNSIVKQFRIATAKKNRVAMMIGGTFGTFVPVAIYFSSHAHDFSWQSVTGGIAGMGLVYSVKTVYEMASQVFGQMMKAAGFVVLLEGVMVTTHIQWLGIVALILLITINTVSAGVNVALGSSK